MTTILEEQLRDLLFHKLSRNGFDGIVMESNAKYCQFGMSLQEILHLLRIRLYNYLWKGFNNKLSGAVRKKLYLVSINMIIRLSGHKSENLAGVLCFRNGITKRKHIMTGKEKLARIFLLYTCFLDTEYVEDLRKSRKWKNANYNTPEFIWIRPK